MLKTSSDPKRKSSIHRGNSIISLNSIPESDENGSSKKYNQNYVVQRADMIEKCKVLIEDLEKPTQSSNCLKNNVSKAFLKSLVKNLEHKEPIKPKSIEDNSESIIKLQRKLSQDCLCNIKQQQLATIKKDNSQIQLSNSQDSLSGKFSWSEFFCCSSANVVVPIDNIESDFLGDRLSI